ncbi:DgyrCDS13666 [Dimorphilus gyrociliatus]|uniref:DgyrCDS13666 n=1 Tax=Dimorphilus gyrociliatus TaxID=2664684 RepID=A0A7I8WBC7_9ANNE|nr:DgyrCDS13666 [Dimorphilus gyrociliatus]
MIKYVSIWRKKLNLKNDILCQACIDNSQKNLRTYQEKCGKVLKKINLDSGDSFYQKKRHIYYYWVREDLIFMLYIDPNTDKKGAITFLTNVYNEFIRRNLNDKVIYLNPKNRNSMDFQTYLTNELIQAGDNPFYSQPQNIPLIPIQSNKGSLCPINEHSIELNETKIDICEDPKDCQLDLEESDKENMIIKPNRIVNYALIAMTILQKYIDKKLYI